MGGGYCAVCSSASGALRTGVSVRFSAPLQTARYAEYIGWSVLAGQGKDSGNSNRALARLDLQHSRHLECRDGSGLDFTA